VLETVENPVVKPEPTSAVNSDEDDDDQDFTEDFQPDEEVETKPPVPARKKLTRAKRPTKRKSNATAGGPPKAKARKRKEKSPPDPIGSEFILSVQSEESPKEETEEKLMAENPASKQKPKPKQRNIAHWKCKGCPRKFQNRMSYLVHSHKAHGIVVLEYLCDLCPYDHADQLEILCHRASHEFKEGDDTMPCFLCPEVLADKDSLASHLKSHLKKTKQVEYLGYSLYKLNESILPTAKVQNPPEDPTAYTPFVSCYVCGRRFKNVGRFEQHIGQHLNREIRGDRVVCDLCGTSVVKP
jgi:hypothetical protein